MLLTGGFNISVLLSVILVSLSEGYRITSLRMTTGQGANPFASLLAGFNKKSVQPAAARRTVVVTGASGLVGKELVKSLESRDIFVKRLTTKQPSNENEIFWDPTSSILDVSELEGVDAVVHLAGENIASGSTEGPLNALGRWSETKKQKIYRSRIDGTRLLVNSLQQLKKKPKVLVSTSAVGFYGYTDSSTVFDESSPRGQGFLADVCEGWEEEALKYSKTGRTVCLRFGVVMANQGGVLAKLKPLFNLAAGGNLGSGEQGFPWVSINDVVRGIEFALDTPSLTGPANLVAPQISTNADFTKALGRYATLVLYVNYM
jgi:uncharacterized protein (TIGR01777 family)